VAQLVILGAFQIIKSCYSTHVFKHHTVRSESRCALTKGARSDVHERLYRPEPV
jgi:hypothetical protein